MEGSRPKTREQTEPGLANGILRRSLSGRVREASVLVATWHRLPVPGPPSVMRRWFDIPSSAVSGTPVETDPRRQTAACHLRTGFWKGPEHPGRGSSGRYHIPIPVYLLPPSLGPQKGPTSERALCLDGPTPWPSSAPLFAARGSRESRTFSSSPTPVECLGPFRF